MGSDDPSPAGCVDHTPRLNSLKQMRTGELGHWWRSLGGPPAPRAPLPGPASADVVIVGARYTGLRTAYYLKRAQPALEIVVPEREHDGFVEGLGVKIYESTPVSTIPAHEARTPAGSVNARWCGRPRATQPSSQIGWDGSEVLGDAAHVYVYAPIDHAWSGVLGVPRDWCVSINADPRTGLAWAGGYVGESVAAANLAGRTLRPVTPPISEQLAAVASHAFHW
jgi:hypothetical protein